MMYNVRNITGLFLILSSLCNFAQTPEVRYEDKIRIKEAITIRNEIGESIWDGITKVPFALILVTKDFEYLMNHPTPTPGFIFLENDAITNNSIYYRKTTFPLYLQATFPAVNGLSCIVMGIPENTKSSSSNWILTLLHENFHQYQAYQPYHYDETAALNLSNGDTSGMWQLNYPFPYKEENVNTLYKEYATNLITAVQNVENKDFDDIISQYTKSKTRFKKGLTKDEYRYFSFQLWKEGIARYTEYKYLEKLKNFTVSEELQNLKDFIPFKKLKNDFFETEITKLKEWKLSEVKREVIYPLGFAEGILLDALNPFWHVKYFSEKFNIENITE